MPPSMEWWALHSTNVQRRIVVFSYLVCTEQLVHVDLFYTFNDAKFITWRERLVAIERLRVGQPGIANKLWVVTDPKVWLMFLFNIWVSISHGGVTNSLPWAKTAGHAKKVTLNAVVFVTYCITNIIGPKFFTSTQDHKIIHFRYV
ncbi:hypothetical protein LX36DRAFT_670356 [Colletotrichum falcatum]|nr:hypothetical protein LX36DRAFT_670356 [Colletotrichum falcatum]